MKKSIRAALLACAVLGALAFAGSALASYAPKLVVGPADPGKTGSGGTIRIGVVVGSSDDPTAKVQIYVPNGFAIATPAAGTTIGTVTATASAADLGGAILPLTGNLVVTSPNPTAAAQCLGSETASQYWDLHLSAAGQTLDVPLYVVTASAPEQAAGYQAKLEVCLPPPDVPVGTPGRATFGAKLLSATMGVNPITQPSAPGSYRWTSIWTPYTPGKGTPNPAGTVETQSIRALPTLIDVGYKRTRIAHTTTKRVHGRKHKVTTVSTRIRWTSSVTVNGKTVTPNATVAFAGVSAKKLKRIGGASGSYTFKGKSIVFMVGADVYATTSVPTGTPAADTDLYYSDLGATSCVKTAIFGGVPCVDATASETVPLAIGVIKGFTT
jgi:hypothetical protein